MKRNNPGCNCCDIGCPPITCEDDSEKEVNRVDVTVDGFISSHILYERNVRYFEGNLTAMNGSFIYERTTVSGVPCKWPNSVGDVLSVSGNVYRVTSVDLSGCPATWSAPFAATGTISRSRSVVDNPDGTIRISHSFTLSVSYSTFFGPESMVLPVVLTGTTRCNAVDMVLDVDSDACEPDEILGTATPDVT